MIILEGPDGSGKSTLARILANVFDTEVFHPGGAPDPNLLKHKNLECISKLSEGFVCDRVNQISEYVYGPIMNDRQLFDINGVLEFCRLVEDNKWPLIYCRPEEIMDMEDNQTEEKGRDTAENTAKLKDRHRQIVQAYDGVFLDIIGTLDSNNFFVYDYTNPGEFKVLLKFLKQLNPKLNTIRPSADQYFIDMAKLVSSRGTCCRRKVGCVLTDSNKYVLATGYNGRPKGFEHCSEGKPCKAAAMPSGMNLEGCEALHAEQNALLQCKDVQTIDTAYVTLFPCVTCTKLLLNTSCKRIVYSEEYVQPEAVELWERAGHTIIYIKEGGQE